jgi:hypothetical protein
MVGLAPTDDCLTGVENGLLPAASMELSFDVSALEPELDDNRLFVSTWNGADPNFGEGLATCQGLSFFVWGVIDKGLSVYDPTRDEVGEFFALTTVHSPKCGDVGVLDV